MAKVEYMNSIFSGKLGGLVYAFNKAGNYVRTFRKPTQPDTLAQLNNRATFASATTAWHGLSDIEKGNWNTFAVTNFKPKFGVTGVRFSGFNAFVSLRNTAINLNRQVTMGSFDLPAGLTFTPIPFTLSEAAPTLPMSAFIKTSAGAALYLQMTTVTVSAGDGSVTAEFQLIGPSGPGPITSAPVFQDFTGGNPVGIVFSTSLPIVQDNMYVENPDYALTAIFQAPGTITGWTTGSAVTIIAGGVLDYPNRKFSFQENDIVQIKAYLVSTSGMTMPLGAVKTAMTA